MLAYITLKRSAKIWYRYALFHCSTGERQNISILSSVHEQDFETVEPSAFWCFCVPIFPSLLSIVSTDLINLLLKKHRNCEAHFCYLELFGILVKEWKCLRVARMFFVYRVVIIIVDTFLSSKHFFLLIHIETSMFFTLFFSPRRLANIWSRYAPFHCSTAKTQNISILSSVHEQNYCHLPAGVSVFPSINLLKKHSETVMFVSAKTQAHFCCFRLFVILVNA